MRERTAVKVARFVPGRGERVIFPSYSTVGKPVKDGVAARNLIYKIYFAICNLQSVTYHRFQNKSTIC
ncbi:hypothetical protein BGV40_11980 [Methanosarcina sp. Ant1]|nr:hypothetical protein BGV40_11980 [Methanosarcina sp. Ant1]